MPYVTAFRIFVGHKKRATIEAERDRRAIRLGFDLARIKFKEYKCQAPNGDKCIEFCIWSLPEPLDEVALIDRLVEVALTNYDVFYDKLMKARKGD